MNKNTLSKAITSVFMVVVVLSIPAFLQAQETTVVDSLKNALKHSKEDTLRVLLLDELGWVLKSEEPEVARDYLIKARQLAEKLNYKRGLGKAWNDLGVLEDIHGDYDAAIAAYEKALEIREEIGDRKGIASVYNNIANVNDKKGDFINALKIYQKSLHLLEELGDSARIARLYYNMGDLHERMGNYPEAQDYIYRYLIYNDKTGDKEASAYGHNILGNIYFELGNYNEALDWYDKAHSLFDEYDYQWEKASVLNNMAAIKGDLAEMKADSGFYDEAFMLFDSAILLAHNVIEIRKELNDQPGVSEALNNLGVFHKDRGSYYKETGLTAKAADSWEKSLEYFREALQIREEAGDKKGIIEAHNGFGDVYRRQGNYKKALEYTYGYLKMAEEISDFKYIQNAYKDLSKIYSETGDFKNAYEFRKKYDELRYERLNEQRVKDFERRQILYGDQRKEIEIERQQQRNALLDAQLSQQQAEIERAAVVRNSLIGGGIGLLLLAGLLYNRNRIKTKANHALAEKNEIIQAERQRSENLLLNILPEQTAEELKAKGRADAKYYDSVTVLFSDFKSFTTIAEKMSPEALVAELDECFRAFDDITRKYGIEKIKTIGDSYMCAGGLPTPNDTHAADMVKAAIEMQEFMENRRRENPGSFQMRIGIHTGPVVAGIVGSRKFAYDIWGDTVNLAARMEQSGEPGKINVSQATYERLDGRFYFTPRGKIAAKNKGEVEMYFVEQPSS